MIGYRAGLFSAALLLLLASSAVVARWTRAHHSQRTMYFFSSSQLPAEGHTQPRPPRPYTTSFPITMKWRSDFA